LLLTARAGADASGAGACEGSVACSTCHVILSPEHYEALEEPGDDENDMLDMAFGLSDTSRLGCQVHLTKAMDGMSVQLPAATRNMFVDGTGVFPDDTSAAMLTFRRRTQADTPLECRRPGCVHVDTLSLCVIDICFLQLSLAPLLCVNATIMDCSPYICNADVSRSLLTSNVTQAPIWTSACGQLIIPSWRTRKCPLRW
jgi:ferredoxin